MLKLLTGFIDFTMHVIMRKMNFPYTSNFNVTGIGRIIHCHVWKSVG